MRITNNDKSGDGEFLPDNFLRRYSYKYLLEARKNPYLKFTNRRESNERKFRDEANILSDDSSVIIGACGVQ